MFSRVTQGEKGSCGVKVCCDAIKFVSTFPVIKFWWLSWNRATSMVVFSMDSFLAQSDCSALTQALSFLHA